MNNSVISIHNTQKSTKWIKIYLSVLLYKQVNYLIHLKRCAFCVLCFKLQIWCAFVWNIRRVRPIYDNSHSIISSIKNPNHHHHQQQIEQNKTKQNENENEWIVKWSHCFGLILHDTYNNSYMPRLDKRFQQQSAIKWCETLSKCVGDKMKTARTQAFRRQRTNLASTKA